MQDNSKVFQEILDELKGDDDEVLTKKENGIFHLTLNRPKKYNSLSLNMYLAIGEAVDRASKDPEVKAIVFSGNGKYFCSGNDLTGFLKIAEKFPDFSENYEVIEFLE